MAAYCVVQVNDALQVAQCTSEPIPGSEIPLNSDFRFKIEVFRYFPKILIKYDRWLRPRATQTYSRDETDLIEQVRGSDFVAESTFPLTIVEKWILYLVKVQILTCGRGTINYRAYKNRKYHWRCPDIFV